MMFKYIGLIILLMIIRPEAIYPQSYAHIVDYQVNFAAVSYKGKPYIGIRSFRDQGQDYVLSVDPNTLETYVVKSADCKIVAVSRIQQIAYFPQSVYAKS